jgi:hypothetical protein
MSEEKSNPFSAVAGALAAVITTSFGVLTYFKITSDQWKLPVSEFFRKGMCYAFLLLAVLSCLYLVQVIFGKLIRKLFSWILEKNRVRVLRKKLNDCPKDFVIKLIANGIDRRSIYFDVLKEITYSNVQALILVELSDEYSVIYQLDDGSVEIDDSFVHKNIEDLKVLVHNRIINSKSHKMWNNFPLEIFFNPCLSFDDRSNFLPNEEEIASFVSRKLDAFFHKMRMSGY